MFYCFFRPTNKYTICSKLNPGNHKIEGVKNWQINDNKESEDKVLQGNFDFELKKNQITILNKTFIYEQKPYDASGVGWQARWKFQNTTNAEKRNTLSLLRKDPNFNYWTIYEPSIQIVEEKTEVAKVIVSSKKSNLDQNRFCTSSFFDAANNENTVKSYKKFLDYCSDKTSYWYLTATRELEELQKQKEPEPKVVLPKVTASPPKVSDQSEKPQTIIYTGSIGEIPEVRMKILEKTLESKLDDYFDIVPQELFEEAKKTAWDEMDECTVERCIVIIQDILQVPNAFQLMLMVEEGDTQISLTWNDMQRKRVEEDYCEGCKTKELREMIEGLVEKLVGR